MKTITIHALDKNSASSYSRTIQVDGKTKEQLKKEIDGFFSDIPFPKWYYEVEDELTDEDRRRVLDLFE